MQKPLTTLLGKAKDGHTRITCTEQIEVRGGCGECHDQAVERAVRLEEGLNGKRIQDCSASELAARLNEAASKVG